MYNINLVENIKQILSTPLDEYEKIALIKFGDKLKQKLSLRINPIILEGQIIKVNGICGSFIVNDIQLNILPKFINIDINEINKENFQIAIKDFLYFCEKVDDNMIYISDKGKLQELWSNNLLEYIANIFIESLSLALKIHPISWYSRKKSKLPYIKGSIIVEKEVNKLGVFDGTTWCRYSSFDKDNKFNCLLKWTCNFLINKVKSTNIKRKLENLKVHFIEVKEVRLSINIVKNMTLPKQYDFYKESFDIAKKLFLSTNFGYMDGTQSVYGIVLNTEKCYEKFISGCIKKASMELGYKHYCQKQNILAKPIDGTSGYFYTKPDDIVQTEIKSIIMDAKYKVLSRKETKERGKRIKPTNSDFYQMISSCITYNTNVAVLFYPRVKNEPIEDAIWKVINPVNGKFITVLMLPINLIIHHQNRSLKEELISRFKAAIKLANKY